MCLTASPSHVAAWQGCDLEFQHIDYPVKPETGGGQLTSNLLRVRSFATISAK
jgi:hypothetical protein